jgi:hypothetical protein
MKIFIYLLNAFLFFSCKLNKEELKTIDIEESNTEIVAIDSAEISCFYTNDTFSSILINQFDLRKMNKTQFSKLFGNPDSTDKDGYMFYGLSYFYFNKSGIVSFSIASSRFKINNYQLNDSSKNLIINFPCSYKERYIESITYKEQTILAEKIRIDNLIYFDKIVFTVYKGKIIEIYYSIDEDFVE